MSKRRTPPVPAGRKWCLGCQAALPLMVFPSNPSKPDGHEARCNPCLKEQRRLAQERRGIVRKAAQRIVARQAWMLLANR